MVESRHRVAVAVVDAGGRLRARAGAATTVTYARSALKPIQALPLIEDGVAERFGLSARELALCCGSHGGELIHVEAAASILRKIGADETALVCGPHAPLHPAAAKALEAAGRLPRRLHNNCSGKHAGMLALARHHGWSMAGYEQAQHPLQQRVLDEVARWCGVPIDEIGTAVDGCGVITFALSLPALARSFALLAAGARRSAQPSAASAIVRAMTRCPEYVGGTERLCTELIRVTEGRVFAKVGAEGVYCAGVPGAELGIALKIEDGARRAAEPALLAVLRTLGLLAQEELGELGRFAEPDVVNTRGERVGRVRASLELEATDG